MTMYDRVRRLCNSKGINISNLGDHLPDANVSKSTISHWKNGAVPRAGVVKAMAEYFDVSTEYIMSGNGSAPETGSITIHLEGHEPVAIIDGSKKQLSEQEVALLKLYKGLDVIKKARLLAYASDL